MTTPEAVDCCIKGRCNRVRAGAEEIKIVEE